MAISLVLCGSGTVRAQAGPAPEGMAAGADEEAPAPSDAEPESAPAEPSPPAPAPSSGRRGTPSSSPPLDLCAHRPDPSASYSERKRVVFLNAVVDPNATAPEDEVNDKGQVIGSHSTFAAVHAGELARVTMLTELPLQRFYTVTAPVSPEPSLASKASLTVDDIAGAWGGDDFIRYSAGCADYVMLPTIRRGSASWQKVQREKTVVQNGKAVTVKYLAWQLDASWNLSIRIYKRGGQDFAFETTLQVPNGVLGGFTGGVGRETATIPYHEFASTWPAAGCAVGPATDGQPGSVATCGGLEPEFSPELEDVSMTAASVCGSADDAVDAGGDAMLGLARCGAVTAAEHSVVLMQKELKRWSPMRAVLTDVHVGNATLQGFRLGARDGVFRGDYYLALPSSGAPEQLGFARVAQAGPGGPEGTLVPSIFSFKSGEAPAGSRMQEYAMLGVQLGARPGVLFLAMKDQLATRIAYGGEISLGYDLTRRVAMLDEFWLRGNVGYFKGADKEGLIAIDIGPETVGYLGGSTSVVLGLAFSALIASHEEKVAAADQTITWSGASSGALARLAFEHAFSPDWIADLALEGRSGFSKAKLKSDNSTSVIGADRLVGALGLATVAHTF